MTLLEVMVTLAIVAGVVSGATIGLRAVTRADLRGAAVKLSASMRYLHDRARATARNHRLVLDLDTGSYWAEETDDRFYLQGRPGQERMDADEGAGGAATVATAKKPTSGAGGSPTGTTSITADPSTPDNEPWKPKRAVFQAFKDTMLKLEKLKGVKISQVVTGLRGEVVTSGRAYVHFFPSGFGERAVIELADKTEGRYSLVNHPLTGKVRLVPGKADPALATGELREENR